MTYLLARAVCMSGNFGGTPLPSCNRCCDATSVVRRGMAGALLNQFQPQANPGHVDQLNTDIIMKFTRTIFALFLLCVLSLVVSGCRNTAEGFGRDMERT